MVDFRSGYVAPGVYVSNNPTTSAVSAVGVSATTLCLIGKGQGFYNYSEVISFGSGNTISLSRKGIDATSVIVSGNIPDTNNPGQTVKVVFAKDASGTPHDYSLTTTGTGVDQSTSIVRTTSGTINTAYPVTVTYSYTDNSYLALNVFNDFATFIDVYGNPYDTDGDLVSPLSLAAQIAFENGANQIYAIALDNSNSAISVKLNAAYALTAANYDIDILVPILTAGDVNNSSVANSIIAGLTNHLAAADNDGYPRTAILGLPEDFSYLTPAQLAASSHNKRIMLAWPNAVEYYNTALNLSQTLGGSFLAVAYGGKLASLPVNTGVTRQIIRSFSGFPLATAQTMSKSNRDLWSQSGVAVSEIDRSGRMVVRHGVTTDMTSTLSREFSIVRCQDALYQTLQQSLDQAGLIGSPILPETTVGVKGILVGALETALAAGIIQGYDSVVVRQQALPNGDPTVIECKFSYKPTFPLNYITVSFSINLDTGDVGTLTTA